MVYTTAPEHTAPLRPIPPRILNAHIRLDNLGIDRTACSDSETSAASTPASNLTHVNNLGDFEIKHAKASSRFRPYENDRGQDTLPLRQSPETSLTASEGVSLDIDDPSAFMLPFRHYLSDCKFAVLESGVDMTLIKDMWSEGFEKCYRSLVGDSSLYSARREYRIAFQCIVTELQESVPRLRDVWDQWAAQLEAYQQKEISFLKDQTREFPALGCWDFYLGQATDDPLTRLYYCCRSALLLQPDAIELIRSPTQTNTFVKTHELLFRGSHIPYVSRDSFMDLSNYDRISLEQIAFISVAALVNYGKMQISSRQQIAIAMTTIAALMDKKARYRGAIHIVIAFIRHVAHTADLSQLLQHFPWEKICDVINSLEVCAFSSVSSLFPSSNSRLHHEALGDEKIMGLPFQYQPPGWNKKKELEMTVCLDETQSLITTPIRIVTLMQSCYWIPGFPIVEDKHTGIVRPLRCSKPSNYSMSSVSFDKISDESRKGL